MQRGVFVLVGLFNFHSIPLCGGPYPLPCSTTFHGRDALHLMEACDRIAHVGSVSSSSFRCVGKANLVADSRSRAGLVSFASIFFLRSHLSTRTH